MFGFRRRQERQVRTPEGRRAYAVGDIHGRADLLDQLLATIETDMAARGPAPTHLVFLGDLVDRGPDSRAVVERLRTYRPAGVEAVFLTGNHEEVLLRLLAGERGLLRSWLKFGGRECAQSYGLDPKRLEMLEEDKALDALKAAVPPDHAEFLRGFADTFRFGDYLFVHAGIRPGIDIAAQNQMDLRWIRGAFLEDDSDHGFLVVHGHTISEEVDERPNRIGIDTGAYWSGALTALGVEGTERWYLSTASAAASDEKALAD